MQKRKIRQTYLTNSQQSTVLQQLNNININQFKQARLQSILPKDESESLFYQSICQQYQFCPGFPFSYAYDYISVNYQLLTQIIYNPEELFMYLHNFLNNIFTDEASNPDVLFQSYISICLCIPDLFRDLGKELSQKYVLHLANMLNFNEIQNNPRLFQAGYECLVYTIQDIKPDQDILIQLCQYIYIQLFQQINNKYFAFLLEIPAYYIRVTRNIKNISNFLTEGTIIVGEYEIYKDQCLENDQNIQSSSFTSEESEEIVANSDDLDTSAQIDGKSQRLRYESFSSLDNVLKKIIITSETLTLAKRNVGDTLQLLLFFIVRRVNGELHSNTVQFIDDFCDYLSQTQFGEESGQDFSAKVLYELIILLIESKCDCGQVLNLLDHLNTKRLLKDKKTRLLFILALHYTTYFNDVDSKNKLKSFVETEMTFEDVQTQTLLEISLYLQHQDSSKLSQFIIKVIETLFRIKQFSYLSLLQFFRLISFSIDSQYQSNLKQQVLEEFGNEFLKFLDSHQCGEDVLPILSIIKDYIGSNETQLKKFQECVIKNFTHAVLTEVSEMMFYQIFKILSCFDVQCQIQSDSDNEMIQMLRTIQCNDIELQVQRFNESNSDKLKIYIYQKLKPSAAQLPQNFIDKQIELLSSSNGCIRINAAQLMLGFYREHTEQNILTIELLEQISFLYFPTDVMQLSNKTNRYIIFLENNNFSQHQQSIILHSMLGMLHSRYQFIQEHMEYIFAAVSNLSIFSGQINFIIEYFVKLFEYQAQDNTYFDNYLMMKRDYEYNIYDDYQASQLRRHDNLMVLITMFYNPSKSRQYFDHNVFSETFMNQINYFKHNIIEYGIENPTFTQLNSYQNISTKQFQSYFVKQMYHGFINILNKYRHITNNFNQWESYLLNAIQQHLEQSVDIQYDVISYYINLTVLFGIKSDHLICFLEQLLLDDKYINIIDQLVLAYHQATGSPYILIISQLYNKLILSDQLSNIKFQIMQADGEFNYTNEQCMRFNALQSNYDSYVLILQAIKYKKQKITNEDEGKQEYFNNEFIVSINDRKNFIKAINFPLIFQLNYIYEKSLQTEIIKFIQNNYNDAEKLKIYNMIYAVSNKLDLHQQYICTNSVLGQSHPVLVAHDLKKTITISEQIIKVITVNTNYDIYVQNLFSFRLIDIYQHLFEELDDSRSLEILTQCFIQSQQVILECFFIGAAQTQDLVTQKQIEQIQIQYISLINKIFSIQIKNNIFNLLNKLSVILQQHMHILQPHMKMVNEGLPDQIFVHNAYHNIQHSGRNYIKLVQSMIRYMFNMQDDVSYLNMLDKLVDNHPLNNQQLSVDYIQLLQHSYSQEIGLLLIFVQRVTLVIIQDKIASLLSIKNKNVYLLAIKYFMFFDSNKIKTYLNEQKCNYNRFNALFQHLQFSQKHSEEDKQLYTLMTHLSSNSIQCIEGVLETEISFKNEKMVQQQLLYLFYAKPTGKIFTYIAKIFQEIIIQIPHVLIPQFYDTFSKIHYDIAIHQSIFKCLQIYAENIIQQIGDILFQNNIPNILSLRDQYQYFDIILYQHILSSYGGLQSLLTNNDNIYRHLINVYSTTTIGRFILTGCISSGFTSYILIPLIAQYYSRGYSSNINYFIDFYSRFCDQQSYFAIFDQLIQYKNACGLLEVIFTNYRFSSKKATNTDATAQNYEEEQIIRQHYYNYDPHRCTAYLRQVCINKFLQNSVKHSKTLTTDQEKDKTLYSVLNECMDYNDDFIKALILVMHKAQMKMQITVLQQKLLNKTMSKKYSIRQQAKELLRYLYEFINIETLSTSLFSIKQIYKNNDMYNSVASSVIAVILQQLIFSPVSNVYYKLKELQDNISKNQSLIDNIHDVFTVLQTNYDKLQEQKQNNIQKKPNAQNSTINTGDNSNYLLQSESLKQNSYLLNVNENGFIQQQVLTTQQINVIYDIITTDLYNRSNIDQVHISKLIPEYNQMHAYKVISLVIMQYQFKDAPIESQFIYKQFIRLIGIHSTKHPLDSVKLADTIVAGIIQNPSVSIKQLKGYIDFITNQDVCEYCQLKPEAIMSTQDIKQQILNDGKLDINEKATKVRNSHLLLEKEPERVYGDTTRAVDGSNYDINYCIYIAITLIGQGLIIQNQQFMFNHQNDIQKAIKYYAINHNSQRLNNIGVQITSNELQQMLQEIKHRTQSEERTYGTLLSKDTIINESLDDYLLLGLFNNSEQMLIPLLDIIYYLQLNGMKLNDNFINQMVLVMNQTTNNMVLQVIIKNIIFILTSSQYQKLSENKIIQLAKTAQLLIKDQYTQAVQQVYRLIYVITANIQLQHNFVYEINDFLINHSIQLVTEDEEIINMIMLSITYYILNYKMPQENKIQKIQSLIKLSVEGQLSQSKVLALRILQLLYQQIDEEVLKVLEQQIYISLLAANINCQSNDAIMKVINDCFIALKMNCQRQQSVNYLLKYFGPMLLQERDLVMRCRVLKLIQQLIKNGNADAVQIDEKYAQNTIFVLHTILQNADDNEEYVKIHLLYIATVNNQAYNFDKVILSNKQVIDNENIFHYISDKIKSSINNNTDNVQTKLSLELFSKNQVEYMVDYYIKEMINYDLQIIADHSYFYSQILNSCSETQFITYIDMFVQISEQHYQYVEQTVNTFKLIFERFIQKTTSQNMILLIYQLLLMRTIKRSRQQIQDGIQKIGQILLNHVEHQILEKRTDCVYQQLLKRAQVIVNEQEERINEHKAQRQEQKLKQQRLFNKQFEYLDD